MYQDPSAASEARHRSRTHDTVSISGWVCLAAIVIPWLNPVAGGPSAVTQPWLISAGCALLVWMLAAPEITRRQIGLAILGVAALAAMGHGAPPALLAIGGLTVIAISAAVAASSRSQPWIATAIVTALLIAALVSSVTGLSQYFGLSHHLAPSVNPTEAGEAFANLRQRNQFATLTSIGLAALLWQVRRGVGLSWALPAAALLAAANAASASRTGVLQLVLLAALTFWWVRPLQRQALVCAAALLAYVVAALLLPIALQHLWGISAPNAFGRLASADGCASRGVLWGNVLHLIAQKPLWGWGWGELDYAHFSTLYPGARFCDILDNAHNLPLHLAVELGVPAAVLACGGFLWWLLRQRPWREPDATRQLAWLVIGVILLHSLLEYPLWYGPFQMAFGFALGLLAREHSGVRPGLAGPAVRGVVNAALALALLYSAWDYHRISQLYVSADERSALHRGRPLPRIGDSWLFRDQVAFAELSLTPLTRENAQRIHALAMELLHYSPEPRVIDSAIESAMWIGREDQARWLLARLHAAFPGEGAAAAKAASGTSNSDPRVRH